MNIYLHFTSRRIIDKKTHTKLHDCQIPIYRKVPGSIKQLATTIYIKKENC